MVFAEIAIASSMTYPQEVFNLANELNEEGIAFVNSCQYQEALECFLAADELLPGTKEIQNNIQICREMLE
jgi:hypothetical protein